MCQRNAVSVTSKVAIVLDTTAPSSNVLSRQNTVLEFLCCIKHTVICDLIQNLQSVEVCSIWILVHYLGRNKSPDIDSSNSITGRRCISALLAHSYYPASQGMEL